MTCGKCPHYVRHGKASPTNPTQIVFSDRCALKMKSKDGDNCDHIPFPKSFEYIRCNVYQATFKTPMTRNDAVPTSDFQYSDAFTSASITEMELL